MLSTLFHQVLYYSAHLYIKTVVSGNTTNHSLNLEFFSSISISQIKNLLGGELEYLYRSEYVNFIGGGGYFDVEDKLEQLLVFGPPMIPGPPLSPPTIDIPGETDLDLQHANAYAYSYITPLEDLTFTIGASYDDVDSEFLDENKNQFNPKFGVVWNPLPSTTCKGCCIQNSEAHPDYPTDP